MIDSKHAINRALEPHHSFKLGVGCREMSCTDPGYNRSV